MMTRAARPGVLAIGISVAFAALGACRSSNGSAMDQNVLRPVYSSKRMSDGKQWMMNNLSVNTRLSYCYEDAELNCGRYGRLYTWQAAQEGCQSVGQEWRLPTNDEWRRMTKAFGGVRDDSHDTGTAAYKALLNGGSSGFNALLGGNRSENGSYARLQAHGFYWTASESGPATAWFYNFGEGGLSLNRHRDGDKRMATSVRCVRD
jgi:uncharacterized protein (TIGR02145 family)